MKSTSMILSAALAACAFVAFGSAATPPDQPVLVDTSASAGGVFASSSSSATYTAELAFDGDASTRWLAYTGHKEGGETPMWVTYKFNVPTKVSVLRIRIPSDTQWDERSPKAWTFLGSNDGVNWTTLDTRMDVPWTAGEVKTVSFTNGTAYEYYKFNCTAVLSETSDYMQLYEIEFLYDGFTEDISDLTTTTSGSVSAASTSSQTSVPSKAFDGNRNSSGGRWLAAATNDMYVVYHFAAATAVNAIRIWNGDDSNGCYNSSGRAPKAWTFSGSNDGSVWTPLVARTDETGWSANGESRYYAFYNQTAYAYYKFNCTETNGATDWLQICELEFYNIPQDGPDPTALVYSSELTFPATPAAALENFPVLVRISQTTIDGFLYDACPDSSHLWFTDANGTLLPFEVDSWNASGTSLVWVSVPSLSNSAVITMHWAGDTANVPDDIPASREVWTRAGYRAVWHFNGSAAESVANLTATAVGSPTYNGNASYPGPLGKTLWLDGSSYLSFANDPSWATIGENSTLSISCLARTTLNSPGCDRMISSMSDWKNTSGYELTLQGHVAKITVGSSGTGSSGSQFTTDDSSVRLDQAWRYLTATYSTEKTKLYVNGGKKGESQLRPVVAPTGALSIGAEADGDTRWTGGIDEVRIRAVASTAEWIAEGHATITNTAYISYGEVTADATAPVVATPVVARDAGGVFTVTAVVSQNAPASICCVVGNVTNAMTTSDSELPMTYSATLSGLAADTTCACVVSATSTSGSVVLRTCQAEFYTGDIAVEKISDAAEDGRVPGVFRITRVDTAHNLPIAYTVGGTATAGQTYEPLSGTTIIPAGTNSIDIVVVPILDQQTTSNTTVTVTLAAGLYGIDEQNGSAEMTVVNLAAPAGFNVWVAPSNSLASIGSNWSAGHSPTESEHVLFNGDFSTANCEWDAGAIVASWTQTNGYTGTVTFDTEFPDYSGATFPLFTISGDCGIYSGKWSCRGNYNNFGASVTPMNTTKADKRWCLNVAVGGAMTVASGTAITATGRGYGYTNGIASPAYGGYAWGGGSSPYGSIKEPFEPGQGALAQGDQRNKISGIGGGAIKLVITGTLTLDGSIVALGTADQNIARSGGTGGSIWITASQITGEGKIDASGPTGIGNDQIVGTGSGGRIALYTQSPLAFPIANVACSGTGYKGTSWQWNSRVSGPGTIYVYDPSQANGTLYVKQSTTVSTQNTKWTGTPVMGDLALDAVVISGCASLRIPEGTSLTLPSLASVTTSNSGSGSAGLVYDGGTLNIGSGDQTLKANVAFSSPTAFSFPGNLTLETGAKLGSLNSMYGTAAHCYDQTFTVSVAGDLTIPTGASAGATRCCALTTGSAGRRTAAHGGQSLYLEEAARTNGFDSVLSPTMPGGSMNSSFPAGGAFTLTVGGTLTLDGAITADGGEARGSGSTYAGASAGAGGTINVTAGALAGEGKITADGGCGGAYYAGGAGGGRVSVRLAGAASTFSDWWTTNILARGQSLGSYTAKASSAGTVYLQEAANGEAGGLVVIRNDLAIQAAAANNNATTRYPGNGDGCDTPAALKKTSLLVAGAAHVELTDTMRSAALEIESGSSIDLAGKVFTVNAAKLGERRFATGKYMAGDDAVAGFITDSVGGGMLVISGGGFKLLIR